MKGLPQFLIKKVNTNIRTGLRITFLAGLCLSAFLVLYSTTIKSPHYKINVLNTRIVLPSEEKLESTKDEKEKEATREESKAEAEPKIDIQEPVNWWSYPANIKKVTKTGDNLLVLVNKEYKLPSNYIPSNLTKIRSEYIRLTRTMYIRELVLIDLDALGKAAAEDNIDLSIVSAYRSYTTQEYTYNFWFDSKGGNQDELDKISARAGHSQHQLGTTVDFSTNEVNDNIGSIFHNTKAARWLEENAWKYGFVLAYPQGTESLTGYSYESWHYRYIGVENAAEWKQSGKILELWLRDRNIN